MTCDGVGLKWGEWNGKEREGEGREGKGREGISGNGTGCVGMW